MLIFKGETMRKDVTLKMTYAKPRLPEEGGEAYIYLTETIGRGESKRQVEVPAVGADGVRQGTFILDFDKDGRLLGIEALAASFVLPYSLMADFLKEQ